MNKNKLKPLTPLTEDDVNIDIDEIANIEVDEDFVKADLNKDKITAHYMSEPTINSELILRNNRLKLEKDASLYNDEHLEKVLELRAEYERLDQDDSSGLQKIKRDIRNEIRDLSTKTFVERDDNIFGSMALQIMNNIATRPNFSGYSYLNEMKSLATEHILKYTWKFDSYRQSQISGQFISAFTYISTIVFNAFVATINKQSKEAEKIKKDFMENQKLFHRDPNQSTFGEDHSEVEKVVTIINIKKKLITEIEQIPLDATDILVKYPPEYKIDMKEYIQITQYGEKHELNLSLVRNIPEETNEVEEADETA